VFEEGVHLRLIKFFQKNYGNGLNNSQQLTWTSQHRAHVTCCIHQRRFFPSRLPQSCISSSFDRL